MHQAIPKPPKITSEGSTIDLIVSAIDQRFNQESFTSYAQMETLLVKAANGEDYEAELHTARISILGCYLGNLVLWKLC